jgi:DNA adenine methylase
VLRSPVESQQLARLVHFTPFSRREYDAAFLPSGDPIEQARRTLVKAAMGFGSNSVMRRTGFRSGIRPQGANHATDWSRMPAHLVAIANRLRGIFIEEGPAADVMRRYDSPQTLHYVDPPYPKSLRCEDFRYRVEMTDVEHCELAEVLHSLKGMVIISGYACDLYAELYSGWHRVDRSTHADGGRDRIESLWLSPKTVSQPSLFQ